MTKLNIYKDKLSLFTDIVSYNEKDMIYSEEYNLPVSNKYFIFILDPNNKDFLNYYNKILNNDDNNDENNENNDNDDNEILKDKIKINFDEDQIYNYNILKNNFKDVDAKLENIFNNANESNAEICLVIDIGFILNFIKFFENNSDLDNHILDFLSFKLEHKLDKMFIYDDTNTFSINSLLYLDLLSYSKVKYSFNNSNIKFYTIDNDKNKNYFDDNYITIYKNTNKMYWNILNLNSKVSYDEEYDDEDDINNQICMVEIDDIDSLLTTKNLNELFNANIFNIECNKEVLNPLLKNNIFVSL
jgi:hypothetical protein